VKKPAVFFVNKNEKYHIYIMTNGVTNNLVRRVYDHKKGLLEGFTKKYGLKRLVYYELRML
jgi:putative endonuclease